MLLLYKVEVIMKHTFFSKVIVPYLVWYFVGMITVSLISLFYPIIPIFYKNIFLFIPVDFILLWETVRVPMEKKNDIEFIKYKNTFIFFSSLIYFLIYLFFPFGLLHLFLILVAHIVLSTQVIQLKLFSNNQVMEQNISEYFHNKEKK